LTNNLVSILWNEGDEKLYVEAENMQREAIATESRVLGPEHPDTLTGLISLGVILRRRQQFADAEKVYRETLRIQSRVLGPEHPDTLVLRDNLATALAKQARYQEAEGLYRETRSIQQVFWDQSILILQIPPRIWRASQRSKVTARRRCCYSTKPWDMD